MDSASFGLHTATEKWYVNGRNEARGVHDCSCFPLHSSNRRNEDSHTFRCGRYRLSELPYTKLLRAAAQILKSRKTQVRCNIKNRTSLRFLLVSPVLLVGLALTGPLAPGLYAASFTVNTRADTHDARPGNGVCADSTGRCSLRAAIEESNAGKAARIVVPPTKFPYFLTKGIPLTIKTNLTLVGKDVHIDGCRPRPSPVPGGTPVSWTPRECRASHPTNVLQISNLGTQGTVEISDVSIQYGEGGIGFGTGIRIDAGSSLLLKNSAVIENRSDVGGVGISTNGSLTLIACTVEGNMSRGGGGGVTGFGAGIAIGSNVWVRIIASTIRNNVAVYGGGIGNTGSLVIVGSTLSGNSASEGGAIVNSGGYLAIYDSTIVDNMAGRPTGHPFSRWNGGAVSNYAKGELNITGCTISNNQAVRGEASLTIPATWKSSTPRSPATAPRRVVGFITLGRFISMVG
jgi:CSLREA domain-containing protein